MVAAALVVMLTLALSRWLVEPVVALATPLFTLSWIGWALAVVLVWFFAGGSGPGSGADR
jgi:hypothetical protein